jgi:hypothetical protein
VTGFLICGGESSLLAIEKIGFEKQTKLYLYLSYVKLQRNLPQVST